MAKITDAHDRNYKEHPLDSPRRRTPEEMAKMHGSSWNWGDALPGRRTGFPFDPSRKPTGMGNISGPYKRPPRSA